MVVIKRYLKGSSVPANVLGWYASYETEEQFIGAYGDCRINQETGKPHTRASWYEFLGGEGSRRPIGSTELLLWAFVWEEPPEENEFGLVSP